MPSEQKQPTDDTISKPQELAEAEDMTHEIRRLLVQCEGALDAEGAKEEAERLEHWLESYRRGLSAAQKLSENSESFLRDIRERLTLAVEELQRLEDEGGATSATPEQKARVEDLTRAIRRIDHLVGSIAEASFHHADKEPA